MGQENFREMRKAMVVSQLRPTDVSDPRVIAAMSDVAREDFVPAAQRGIAYADRGVSIGEGRMLNPPLMTGLLINAAQLTQDDNVLLIGAATGYAATVAARLAGSVTAVEQSARLATRAKKALEDIGNVTVHKGNHVDGYSNNALYSAIIIDGIVSHVPDSLLSQLAEGGRVAAAIVEGGVARLAIGHKAGGATGYQYFSDCGGPLLPGFQEPVGFEF